eukprot:608427-Amphidinium_carterae.1
MCWRPWDWGRVVVDPRFLIFTESNPSIAHIASLLLTDGILHMFKTEYGSSQSNKARSIDA